MSPAKKAKRAAATKPVTKKSVATKPTAKKSVAKKPVAKKPVAKKPVAKKPVVKKSPAMKAAAKESAAKQSSGRAALLDTRILQHRAAMKSERRSRAAQRILHVAERMGSTDLVALSAAMHAAIARSADLHAAALPRRASRLMAQAIRDLNRWVPIGPSVVRLGQADGRPRVTGRVRDIAIDATGQRAYAATGKAGVWYTEDAGRSWRPVGGWVTRPGRVGGASTDLSCGCLLVDFGATSADDYVMVGTGEVVAPTLANVRHSAHLDFGGRGVLAGFAPATKADTDLPFELETGISDLENFGIYRLVPDPARAGVGTLRVTGNRVLASTTDGLWLGTRTTVVTVSTWQWTRVAGLDPFVVIGNTPITDVAWIPAAGTADGRILVAIHGTGVAWSDRLGVAGSWRFVSQLNRDNDNVNINGRHSFSALVGDRLYVLGGVDLANKVNGRDNEPFVWRIPTVDRAFAAGVGGPGTAVKVRGVQSELWGGQIEWDQAITAERVGTVDRIWIAGKGITPYTGADYSAALYCYDVIETGAGAPRMGPAIGISRMAAPPAGEGANQSGLVGNGVHADVHAIRVVTLADASRQVWVACDGGVYVSENGGRVNTFQSRGTGLAAVEAGFLTMHPTSSHYCALGAQDNGVQARMGDTMWEMILDGDGGGVMFHPTASQVVVGQFTSGSWFSHSPSGFVGPIDRVKGGTNNVADRESKAAAFYSGCDAIGNGPNRGRIALGTQRVWISDDLGPVGTCTWKVIPAATGAASVATDPRPLGSDAPVTRTRGVPNPSLGAVIQVRWATPTRLYVVYSRGIVRHDEDLTGKWTITKLLVPAQANAPDTTTVRCTDIAPVPGTNDFYFTTLGDNEVLPDLETDTCWFVNAGTFVKTRLRRQLDPTTGLIVLGPLDPAHAVCLDPDNAAVVFVGTIGGIWRGERTVVGPNITHTWDTFMNGLPVTCVSDIRIWKDPLATVGAPKLLRAATQSRGMWEVNLGVTEPQRTYLRVHSRDDRRMPTSTLLDPALAPTAPLLKVYASPDIVVRPARRAPGANAVPFPLLANQVIAKPFNGSYHLWTFQTAFRWRFPAIRADGRWTDQLADLIQLFRSSTAGLGNGNTITKATWDAVVGGTRLDASRVVTAAVTDGFAVYETPWQTTAVTPTLATEVDVFELVQPLTTQNSIWRVYKEPCTVDVLLHHRDTRPLSVNDAYTALFWRDDVSDVTLLAELASTFTALHAWAGGAVVPQPTGWNRVAVAGNAVHKLPAKLDAFMPRAVSIDVDLSGVDPGKHVLFLAVCGSTPESPPPAPAGLTGTSTIGDLVQVWPRAALRLVQVVGPRPV